jgi:hypothetical protein
MGAQGAEQPKTAVSGPPRAGLFPDGAQVLLARGPDGWLAVGEVETGGVAVARGGGLAWRAAAAHPSLEGLAVGFGGGVLLTSGNDGCVCAWALATGESLGAAHLDGVGDGEAIYAPPCIFP